MKNETTILNRFFQVPFLKQGSKKVQPFDEKLEKKHFIHQHSAIITNALMLSFQTTVTNKPNKNKVQVECIEPEGAPPRPCYFHYDGDEELLAVVIE
mmetsp:Transcript_47501/g.60995  ORF Transcript_47501/g.60995 Transcript_47501/m.60995 type:complete len:97 (+) Transcript_47501:87-377(+)